MTPAPSPGAPVYAITEENHPRFPCYLWNIELSVWQEYLNTSMAWCQYAKWFRDRFTYWCATNPGTPPEHASAKPDISPLSTLPANQEAGNQSGSLSQTEPNRDLREAICAALVETPISFTWGQVADRILSVLQPVMEAKERGKRQASLDLQAINRIIADQTKKLTDENTALRAQLAEAEKRLNFLVSRATFDGRRDAKGFVPTFARPMWDFGQIYNDAPTAIEAIDREMKK